MLTKDMLGAESYSALDRGSIGTTKKYSGWSLQGIQAYNMYCSKVHADRIERGASFEAFVQQQYAKVIFGEETPKTTTELPLTFNELKDPIYGAACFSHPSTSSSSAMPMPMSATSLQSVSESSSSGNNGNEHGAIQGAVFRV